MLNFIRGLRSAFHGFTLIRGPGIRRYAVIPLLINASLFALLGYFASRQFGALLGWMLPGWLDWARVLLWPVFALLLLVGGFFVFSLFANLVAAPFNALLTARLIARLRPDTPPSAQNFVRMAAESLLNELRKLRYQALWALPLIVLSFIPPINLLAPFAWFFYGAWMMGIEYLDYPLSETGMPFTEQRALLKRNRALVSGFGTAVLLLSAVPLLNFVVIPAAVAGATHLWAERFRSYR